MSIHRISLEQGIDLPQPEIFDQRIGELILNPPVESVLLAPGEYDLNPLQAKRLAYSHQLIVHPDGRGLYRAIPRDSSKLLNMTTASGSRNQRGGLVANLPEDRAIAVVAGLDTAGRPRLFEIINYTEA